MLHLRMFGIAFPVDGVAYPNALELTYCWHFRLVLVISIVVSIFESLH